MPERTAKAQWEGTIREGGGSVALGSGAFEGPYSFKSRFGDGGAGTATNPEELIGAAHAGCFTMALSLILTEGGTPPEHLDTEARVSIVQEGEGFTIDRIDLTTRGRVPDLDEEGFRNAAQAAKDNCPVSKALASVPEINLDAALQS
jgi:osmotically inducible protein OsmC